MANATVNIVVGRRSSGKTSYLKDIAYSSAQKCLIFGTVPTEDWLDFSTFKNPERIQDKIIQITDEHVERFDRGTAYCFSKDADRTLMTISATLWNATVILEDSRRYVKQILQRAVGDLLINSKQQAVHLIFVYHSLSKVPPELIDLADTLTLFNTNDVMVPPKFKFAGMDELLKHVQSEAKKNPYYKKSVRL